MNKLDTHDVMRLCVAKLTTGPDQELLSLESKYVRVHAWKVKLVFNVSSDEDEVYHVYFAKKASADLYSDLVYNKFQQYITTLDWHLCCCFAITDPVIVPLSLP